MIRAIITDFDGTLVDTFDANFHAYEEAFRVNGLVITRSQYRDCFGLRFDAFMQYMGISDDNLKSRIKKEKARVYPSYFNSLIPNKPLIAFIRKARLAGIKTAIASTAQRENLMNVLNYLLLTDLFDEIIAGMGVKQGKPAPEIYLKAMDILKVSPEETLIFEDSEVGLQAAESSHANYMKISEVFFQI